MTFELKRGNILENILECKTEQESAREYTQVWDRSVLVAKRCLSKESTEDKMTQELGLIYCDKAGARRRRPLSPERVTTDSKLLPISTIHTIQKMMNKSSVKKQSIHIIPIQLPMRTSI